ncbi:MAG: DUF2183 domain-containing protein [Gemmatimonadetes bacterium]|nr:DUF2183 domain-containing protein [Gemmatimonadota bacterium]
MPDPNAIPRTPDPHARPGIKLRVEDRLGMLDPIQLLPFRSFGTPRLLHVRGRVREQKGVEGTTEETSVWRNVSNTVHRLESDEIPGARVRASLGGRTWETTTDAEGYFVLDVEPPEPVGAGWHDVELELVESVGRPACPTARAQVLVPSPDAEFAVISDVDDTVIRTRSTDLLRELQIVFGKGAQGRAAVPGMPALYRALARGPDDRGENPVFYVSKSGWNLYDLLEEFMRLNGLPAGPLFLSDLRLVEAPSEVMGSARHKWDSIDLLMRVYPELPFVLVGDSGMHDPELYREVVQRHPRRVRAVYIHDVSPPERDDQVARIARELDREHGVPLVRMEDARHAAQHAREHGLISARGLDEVRNEVAGREDDESQG